MDSRLCPSTTDDIIKQSESRGCNETLKYHCMLDKEGELIEMCLEITWIEKGKCAVYDNDAEKVDSWVCRNDLGICPEKEYYAFEVILYSACLNREAVEARDPTETAGTTRPLIWIVLYCPVTTLAMILRKSFRRCYSPYKYHCMMDKNGSFIETCTVTFPVTKGKCLIYDNDAGKIDTEECRTDIGICPAESYDSNRVHLYSACVKREPLAHEVTTKTVIFRSVSLFTSTIVKLKMRKLLLPSTEQSHWVINKNGHFIETCDVAFSVRKGKCPIYDNDENKVDAEDCSSDIDRCPEYPFEMLDSDDIPFYPGCVGGTSRGIPNCTVTYGCVNGGTSTGIPNSTDTTLPPSDGSQFNSHTAVIGIGIGIFCLLIILALVVILVYKHWGESQERRNRDARGVESLPLA